MNPTEQNLWHADDLDQATVTPSAPETAANEHVAAEPITWEASEYIHHQKDGVWFMSLVGVVVVLTAISIFLIRSWSFTALIVVMAAAVIVFASRPPRTLRYRVNHEGLEVNEKMFYHHDFRSFGVLQEGPIYSIVLTPTKRFMPAVTIYFPQEHGEKIVDSLGAMIPMEPVELDVVDKLARKLRF